MRQHLTVLNALATGPEENDTVHRALKQKIARASADDGEEPVHGGDAHRVRSSAKANMRVDHGDVAFVVMDGSGNTVSDQIRIASGNSVQLPRIATTVSGLATYTEVKPLGVVLAGPGNNTYGRAATSVAVGGAINIRNTGTGAISYGENIYAVMPSASGPHNWPLAQDVEEWDGIARISVVSGRELARISNAHAAVFTDGQRVPTGTPIFALLHALARDPTPMNAHRTYEFLNLHCQSEVLKNCVAAWAAEPGGAAEDANRGAGAGGAEALEAARGDAMALGGEGATLAALLNQITADIPAAVQVAITGLDQDDDRARIDDIQAAIGAIGGRVNALVRETELRIQRARDGAVALVERSYARPAVAAVDQQRPSPLVLVIAHNMIRFAYDRAYLGTALENALPGQLFKMRINV